MGMNFINWKLYSMYKETGSKVLNFLWKQNKELLELFSQSLVSSHEQYTADELMIWF